MKKQSKIKIPLGTSLQQATTKMHFKRFFPFLRKDFSKETDPERLKIINAFKNI